MPGAEGCGAVGAGAPTEGSGRAAEQRGSGVPWGGRERTRVVRVKGRVGQSCPVFLKGLQMVRGETEQTELSCSPCRDLESGSVDTSTGRAQATGWVYSGGRI